MPVYTNLVDRTISYSNNKKQTRYVKYYRNWSYSAPIVANANREYFSLRAQVLWGGQCKPTPVPVPFFSGRNNWPAVAPKRVSVPAHCCCCCYWALLCAVRAANERRRRALISRWYARFDVPPGKTSPVTANTTGRPGNAQPTSVQASADGL